MTKTYTMPTWEEFAKNALCGGVLDGVHYVYPNSLPIADRWRVYEATYNAIREALAVEGKVMSLESWEDGGYALICAVRHFVNGSDRAESEEINTLIRLLKPFEHLFHAAPAESERLVGKARGESDPAATHGETIGQVLERNGGECCMRCHYWRMLALDETPQCHRWPTDRFTANVHWCGEWRAKA